MGGAIHGTFPYWPLLVSPPTAPHFTLTLDHPVLALTGLTATGPPSAPPPSQYCPLLTYPPGVHHHPLTGPYWPDPIPCHPSTGQSVLASTGMTPFSGDHLQ